MLIPTIVGICIVASLALTPLGYRLVKVAKKGESNTITLTTQSDRFWWAYFGWLIFGIGLVVAPFPYVVMAISHHYDYTGWMCLLGLADFLGLCLTVFGDDDEQNSTESHEVLHRSS